MIRVDRAVLVITIGLTLGVGSSSADSILYSTGSNAYVVNETTTNGMTTSYAQIPNGMTGQSLAFDQSGNLFVLSGQGVIFKASAGSQILEQFCKVSAIEYNGGETGGSRIIANSSGNLFIGSQSGIFEVSSSGQLSATPFAAGYSGGQMAFDSQGNLYAAICYGTGATSEKIEKFSPTGQDLGTVADLDYNIGLTSLAFNGAGNLFASDSNGILEFSSTGQEIVHHPFCKFARS